MANQWSAGILRTQEAIDNYKDHEEIIPISKSTCFDGKVSLDVFECDKYTKEYDNANKFWHGVYARTTGFILWVRVKEVPREVLEEEFRRTIQSSTVNQYQRDTCLSNICVKQTYDGDIVLSWAECEHNPEWVAYEVKRDIYRMLLRVMDKYAPALAKAERRNGGQ